MKNTVIVVLGIAIVAGASVLFLRQPRGPNGKGGGSDPQQNGQIAENPNGNKQDGQPPKNPAVGETTETTVIDGKTNTTVVVAPTKRSVERRPLEPEATKRLHEGPVVISSVFEASGLGEHASYGKAIRGSYLYTTTVMAQSEVKEKEEDKETGKVRVVERRKFLQSRDHLALSDIDVAIALDTLPVDEVKTWCDGACRIVGAASAIVARCFPVTAPWASMIGVGGTMTAKAHVAATFAALHKIDGVSARGLLGAFGVKIPENLEAFVNERFSQWVQEKMRKVHTALQSIEGKSFLITYTQDANGKPLNVDYTNEDGSPITDAEWEILRNANVFLDSNAVPDTRCRVGDSWTIWADEVQELFGVAGDGRAEGKIRVERLADQQDGDWTLRLEPTEVQFRTSDGTAAGKMNIKDGNGLVDAKNVAVKSFHATATGNLRSLNKKRHFLFFDFIKRIDGNSNLRFTLSVAPPADSSAK